MYLSERLCDFFDDLRRAICRVTTIQTDGRLTVSWANLATIGPQVADFGIYFLNKFLIFG